MDSVTYTGTCFATIVRVMVTHHVGEDGRGARPRLDDVLFASFVHRGNAAEKTRRSTKGPFSNFCSRFLPQRVLRSRYFLRRRMIRRLEALLRVRDGLGGFAPRRHRMTSRRLVPCLRHHRAGWSTGFITVPRTVGRMPFPSGYRPALPILMLACSALPTSPNSRAAGEAARGASQKEGMRRIAYLPSR